MAFWTQFQPSNETERFKKPSSVAGLNMLIQMQHKSCCYHVRVPAVMRMVHNMNIIWVALILWWKRDIVCKYEPNVVH